MNSKCHVIPPGFTKQKKVAVWKGRGIFVMQIEVPAFIQAETLLAQSVSFSSFSSSTRRFTNYFYSLLSIGV